MTISNKFNFQFLDGGQSFKHVTTNEALLRLEAMSQLTVNASLSTPPTNPQNGDIFYVSENPTDEFVGFAQHFALFRDGSYQYVAAKQGWQAYFLDSQSLKIYNGQNWVSVGQVQDFTEILHDIAVDGLETQVAFPAHCSTVGVTARVEEALTGSGVNSWSLGVSGALDRYGNGLWLGQNGWVKGLTGTPLTYWSDTNLVITPDAGDITAGKIRFYVYQKELNIPPEV